MAMTKIIGRLLPALTVPLLLASCATFRQQPADPVPPPPPVVLEVAVAEESGSVPSAPHSSVLLLAEAAMDAGLDLGADALASECLRIEPTMPADDRIRVLTLRALVALRHGSDDGRERALAYLRAARQLDEQGTAKNELALSLEALQLLEMSDAELARVMRLLAAARESESRRRAEAEILQTEIEALKKQLDELKAVHLQIESGKKDEPLR